MTTLHYSNRTEALLERLAADVGAHRAERGPWEPLTLVVPNRNVQIWLQQGLSDALGIAANLRFCFLDRLWRESLPASGPPLRLLDRPALQGQLLALFEDPALLAETGFDGYLAGDAGGRKAAQLSGRLARLFEEYLLSRPDWMARWEAGRPASEDPREGPQRRLWQALRIRLKGGPHQWISLPEYFESGLLAQGRFPDRVFAFGLSQMARTYHEGFRRLGAIRPVDLYVLNPCGEFWEDVRGPRETAPEEDPYGLLLEEHLGLQRWGRPGRENIHLLNDLVDCDFEDHFREPGEATLLARLQSDLLHRAPTLPADPPQPVDGSLRVVACASPRREAEAVASAIWEIVQAASLRFSDIAVIVPPSQKDAYLDHLRAAFEACHRIPWIAGDEGSRRMAELLDGAERLLRWPLSAFSRAELLALVDHPAVTARFPGLEGDWAALCEDLGVVRGLAQDRAQDPARDADGASPDAAGDLWTWDMGARRLALGAVMPPGELDLEGISDPVRPPDQGAGFLALARGLLTDARRLRDQRRTPTDWALDLARFLGGYLGDGDADAGPLARIQRAIEGLGGLDAEGLVAPRLPYAGVLDMVLELLSGLRTEAAMLGQGVMVASYAPMRALPFQAVFLLGLGEGVFPGQDVRNPLDLRSARRRSGDVSRAEQDRYLFLESLLCARRHLHLSYVRRDPGDGTALEPSPLLEDFRECVTALAGREGWRALVHEPPINRFDETAFRAGSPPEFSPAALREARAAELGPGLRRAAGPRPLGWHLAGLDIAEPVRRALEVRLHQVPPLAAEPSVPRGHLRISFAQLRKWLSCPLQGAAATRLGLRDEDDGDEAERDEEAFETPFLDRRAWMQRAFFVSLSGPSAEAALRRGWRALLAQAKAPVGIFAEAELARATAVVEGWRSQWDGGAPGTVRFGAADSRDGNLPAVDQPAFRWVLDGEGTVRVDLEGCTPPLAPEGFILLSERKAPAPGRAPEAGDVRDLLKAWVAHAALRARDLPSPGRAVVLSVRQGEAVRWEIRLPEWTQAEAEARLRGWCEDLLAGDPGPLPIEALVAGTEDLEDWIEKAQDQVKPAFSSLWGPIPDGAEQPVAPDWAQRGERRLGDFLRACRGEGAGR
ncbi:MAG: exodeoxyribonuclease V subunit gamma [Geothrix sp.]|nr:exodeoxyribonuclease V subunit gamma [Geothrix sp.]